MIYVFFWIVLCALVAVAGKRRKIGAGTAFVVSLLLSPLVGIICVAFSKDKQQDAIEKNILREQQRANILRAKPIASDWTNLEAARKLIGEEEYQWRKRLLEEADRLHS